MKEVCVVGATGILGSHISNKLTSSSHYHVQRGGKANCDVRYPLEIEGFFSKIEQLHGLVYCSALKSEATALDNPSELSKLLEVNLLGAINCIQIALRRNAKKIVVVGSADGTFGNYQKTMYAVSKAALHEYVRCLGAQLKGSGKEIICVVPGTIKNDEDKEDVASFIKLFMDGQITGLNSQLIRIDGGHHTFPI